MVELYYQYLKKGASVLTTFTFRTGGMLMKGYEDNHDGYKSVSLTKRAVDICKQAIQKYKNESEDDYNKNKKILIAGSVAPSTICYHKTEIDKFSDSEIKEFHLKNIKLLLDNDCDIIMNETIGHLREVRILNQISKDLGIVDKTLTSLFCEPDGTLSGGEPIIEAIQDCVNNGIMVGLNCITSKTVHQIISANIDLFKSVRWTMHVNYGDEDYLEDYRSDFNFEDRQKSAGYNSLRQLVSYVYKHDVVPIMIGLCCNSVPDDIAKLCKMI